MTTTRVAFERWAAENIGDSGLDAYFWVWTGWNAALTQSEAQPVAWTDADADAARLALELECLLTTKKSTECHWLQDDEDSDTWATTCGHYFSLNEGAPSENGMRFCCYCGKQLIELRFED